MTYEKIYFLSKVNELSELTIEELHELAQKFHWMEYSQGSNIMTRGHEGSHYFVLTNGMVEVIDSKESDREVRVNTFGPCAAIGARALLTGGKIPFTVRTLENSKFLVASSDDFSLMLTRWPKLYRNLIERMSNNLDQVNNGLWEARNKEFLRTLLEQNQYKNKLFELWGGPKTTRLIENKLLELAKRQEHLLIIGERGTGRRMLAWHLHRKRFGERAPFIAVNGRDLENQWGDKIFEVKEKTDTEIKKINLLEFVKDGTLYINEINGLSLKAQLNLAQTLRSSSHNCLVIGSIHDTPDLTRHFLVPELRNVFSEQFKLKPLRERKRDIPFLVQEILEKLSKEHGRTTPSLDPEVTKLLLSHNYRHGNTNELIQVIERAFLLAEHDVISLEHVFFGPTAPKTHGAFNLLSLSWLKELITKGTFLLGIRRVMASTFLLLVVCLLLNHQTTINWVIFTLTWGLWWPILAIISPILGRVWCTVCPFSFIMEIIQKRIHLDYPVPDFLKKYDYLFVTFLFALIFWVEIIFDLRSNPVATAILLLIILGAAVITGILFQRHAWCHHMCPLGGFVGTASIGALLEIRADATVCQNKCTTYDCYKGNIQVQGCPMSQHIPYIDNNLDCKLCFNCIQSCTNGAVQLNLRFPGREVWHLLRVNQGYVIFIGVTLVILFPINYFEPLSKIWPTSKWVYWFSFYYWGIALLAGFLTWHLARPFRTKAASRRIKFVFALVPLVIAGHIIYQLHFLPGANVIFLGLGYQTLTNKVLTYNVPLYRIGHFLAGLMGLILTGFTLVKIIRVQKCQTRHFLHHDK